MTHRCTTYFYDITSPDLTRRRRGPLYVSDFDFPVGTLSAETRREAWNHYKDTNLFVDDNKDKSWLLQFRFSFEWCDALSIIVHSLFDWDLYNFRNAFEWFLKAYTWQQKHAVPPCYNFDGYYSFRIPAPSITETSIAYTTLDNLLNWSSCMLNVQKHKIIKEMKNSDNSVTACVGNIEQLLCIVEHFIKNGYKIVSGTHGDDSQKLVRMHLTKILLGAIIQILSFIKMQIHLMFQTTCV